MRLATLRPAQPGDLVPMPERPLPGDRYELLPEEGREVDADNFYWFARLRDGSVVEVQPAAEQTNTAPKPSTGSPAPVIAKD